MYMTIQDGEIQKHEGVPTLEEMQKVVGGWIEPVDFIEDEDGRISIYVNEEGLMHNLPFTFHIRGAVYHGDVDMFGDAVIVRCDNEGETVGLTEDDLEHIAFGRTAMIHLSRSHGVTALPVLEWK